MRVMQIGVGTIGSALARLLLRKPGWQLVAAMDTDPTKQGRDLGTVIGLKEHLGVTVARDLFALRAVPADVAFLTTVSTFPEVLPTLKLLIQQGVNVVASTEELFYPYYRYAAEAHALDALAKQRGVSILGTGITPGFVMDTLVLVLTGVSQQITRVAVTRVVNASGARPTLQKSLGLGLTPAVFADYAAQRRVGVFGMVESLAFLAHVLRWPMDEFKERLVPVMAEKPVCFSQGSVAPGAVCGVRYGVKGLSQGKEVISFDLRMYLDAEQTRDTIYLEGTPTLEMTIKSSDMGDIATAGVLVNMAPLVHRARPGLLSMVDLPLPHWQR
ncbi:MAG: dihydrodipicolinate reductase [Candidatus Tectimicrobiota bacterium]